MTRTASWIILPLCLLPVLVAGGCARPQRTPNESAGRIAPPQLNSGTNPPGGVTMAYTGGGAGGSEAGGMQYIYGRVGGPEEQPVVSAPGGVNIFQFTSHRMSPTTNNASEGNSSDGSGTGDASNAIPPNVPINPRYAPGADLHESPGGAAPAATP